MERKQYDHKEIIDHIDTHAPRGCCKCSICCCCCCLTYKFWNTIKEWCCCGKCRNASFEVEFALGPNSSKEVDILMQNAGVIKEDAVLPFNPREAVSVNNINTMTDEQLERKFPGKSQEKHFLNNQNEAKSIHQSNRCKPTMQDVWSLSLPPKFQEWKRGFLSWSQLRFLADIIYVDARGKMYAVHEGMEDGCTACFEPAR